jgi:hypothetical protein
MIRTGPDGALWIADMYRQVIEHPQWIPASWQKRLDLRAGTDRGRIYRVTIASEERKPFPALRQQDTPGLLVALHSPNGWLRDMAQQMLIWGKDEKAVPLLEELVTDAKRPTTRLHALATLDGMRKLDAILETETVSIALRDIHPGVRRHAVRLVLGRRPWPEFDLTERVAERADDADAFVRQQVAYGLGEIGSRLEIGKTGADASEPVPEKFHIDGVGTALARIALRDADNPYIVAAVLSSVHASNIVEFGGTLLAAKEPPAGLIEQLVAIAAGMDDKAVIHRMLMESVGRAAAQDVESRLRTVAGLLAAMRRG